VKTGKIDLHTFVNCASTQAAKTFDLFPRKGTIQLARTPTSSFLTRIIAANFREDASHQRGLQRV